MTNFDFQREQILSLSPPPAETHEYCILQPAWMEVCEAGPALSYHYTDMPQCAIY